MTGVLSSWGCQGRFLGLNWIPPSSQETLLQGQVFRQFGQKAFEFKQCINIVFDRLDQPLCLEKRHGGAGKAASEAQFTSAEELYSNKWTTIVEMSALGAGYKDTCKSYLVVKDQGPFTHIRLNIFPDGGVARLRCAGNTLLYTTFI